MNGDIVRFRFKNDRPEFEDLIGFVEYQTQYCAFKIVSSPINGAFKIDDEVIIEVIRKHTRKSRIRRRIEMLKINPEKDIKELEKFGFKKRNKNCYEYIREIKGKTVYRIYTTLRHKYIQIEIFEPCKIAGSIQELLYDLIKADMVVKE